MSNEREDSFADDPLKEIDLDNDDLDDLLGDSGKEDSNKESSDEGDDDLLSGDDLLDEEDLEPESDNSESDQENSAEISEEELDSLLAEADSPGEDEASEDELPIELSEDDEEDATDVLGEDDVANDYPEVPDTLPEDLVSELEEDDDADTDLDTENLVEESEEEEKKAKSSSPKGKKKGFAARDKDNKDTKKRVVDLKKPAAAKGKMIDFICSECYSVLSLSATWSEDLVTCPECFHVGKKPDDSFLRTVSTAKAREGKKARMLTVLTLLVIASFSGIVFLKSAYGDAAAMSKRAQEQKTVNESSTGAEGTEATAEEISAASEGDMIFFPKTEKKHEDTVELWTKICMISGGLFLLLLIWQACVYEGNRWEAYF